MHARTYLGQGIQDTRLFQIPSVFFLFGIPRMVAVGIVVVVVVVIAVGLFPMMTHQGMQAPVGEKGGDVKDHWAWHSSVNTRHTRGSRTVLDKTYLKACRLHDIYDRSSIGKQCQGILEIRVGI